MPDPAYGFARAVRFLTKQERVKELFDNGHDTIEIALRMADQCPDITEADVWNLLPCLETERPDMRSRWLPRLVAKRVS